MRNRWQFVWWGFRGMHWGFKRPVYGYRKIYRYSLCVGPLEIRRWENP